MRYRGGVPTLSLLRDIPVSSDVVTPSAEVSARAAVERILYGHACAVVDFPNDVECILVNPEEVAASPSFPY
jgi:hypothetical protein